MCSWNIGKVFSSGLDLSDHSSSFGSNHTSEHDVGREAIRHRRFIQDYQESFTGKQNSISILYYAW